MPYWVYENWTAEHKAVLHDADCGYCNKGLGSHPNPRGNRNGKWHGPFDTLPLAEAAAKHTGRPVRKHDCKAPRRGNPLTLAGLVDTYWKEGGQIRWTWDDLLKHTIAADQELESSGLDPAPAFRRYRLATDTDKMYRYIVGFYTYPFSPNHKDRNSKPEPSRVKVAGPERKDILGGKDASVGGSSQTGSFDAAQIKNRIGNAGCDRTKCPHDGDSLRPGGSCVDDQ